MNDCTIISIGLMPYNPVVAWPVAIVVLVIYAVVGYMLGVPQKSFGRATLYAFIGAVIFMATLLLCGMKIVSC